MIQHFYIDNTYHKMTSFIDKFDSRCYYFFLFSTVKVNNIRFYYIGTSRSRRLHTRIVKLISGKLKGFSIYIKKKKTDSQILFVHLQQGVKHSKECHGSKAIHN